MLSLYTYGYTGGSLDDLKRLVASGAIIADIRYQPRSRVPHWNKGPLAHALGTGYVHVPALGNQNYKGDRGPDIQIADLETGLDTLHQLLERSPVVLLCACADYRTCHRNTVAKAAQDQLPGVKLVHLQPGCPGLEEAQLRLSLPPEE